jgi:hypothetical protein
VPRKGRCPGSAPLESVAFDESAAMADDNSQRLTPEEAAALLGILNFDERGRNDRCRAAVAAQAAARQAAGKAPGGLKQ